MVAANAADEVQTAAIITKPTRSLFMVHPFRDWLRRAFPVVQVDQMCRWDAIHFENPGCNVLVN